MISNAQPIVSIYPITTCTFGSKDEQPEEHASTEQQLSQLKARYCWLSQDLSPDQLLQGRVENMILHVVIFEHIISNL